MIITDSIAIKKLWSAYYSADTYLLNYAQWIEMHGGRILEYENPVVPTTKIEFDNEEDYVFLKLKSGI